MCAGWCRMDRPASNSSLLSLTHLYWHHIFPPDPWENFLSAVCLQHFISLVCLLGNIPPIPSIHPFLSCLKAQLRQMQRSGWHLLPTFGWDVDLPWVPHPLFPLHVLRIQRVVCSCSFGQPRSFSQMGSFQMRNVSEHGTRHRMGLLVWAPRSYCLILWSNAKVLL